jgi:hypothetical protein
MEKIKCERINKGKIQKENFSMNKYITNSRNTKNIPSDYWDPHQKT